MQPAGTGAGSFRMLAPSHREGAYEIWHGQAPSRRPVTMVLLGAQAAKDQLARRAFAEAAEWARAGGDQDLQVLGGDPYAPTPWVALVPDGQGRGVARFLDRLFGGPPTEAGMTIPLPRVFVQSAGAQSAGAPPAGAPPLESATQSGMTLQDTMNVGAIIGAPSSPVAAPSSPAVVSGAPMSPGPPPMSPPAPPTSAPHMPPPPTPPPPMSARPTSPPLSASPSTSAPPMPPQMSAPPTSGPPMPPPPMSAQPTSPPMSASPSTSAPPMPPLMSGSPTSAPPVSPAPRVLVPPPQAPMPPPGPPMPPRMQPPPVQPPPMRPPPIQSPPTQRPPVQSRPMQPPQAPPGPRPPQIVPPQMAPQQMAPQQMAPQQRRAPVRPPGAPKASRRWVAIGIVTIVVLGGGAAALLWTSGAGRTTPTANTSSSPVPRSPTPAANVPTYRADATPALVLGPTFASQEPTKIQAFPDWPFAFRTTAGMVCNPSSSGAETSTYSCRQGDLPKHVTLALVLRKVTGGCNAAEQSQLERLAPLASGSTFVATGPLTRYADTSLANIGRTQFTLIHCFGGNSGRPTTAVIYQGNAPTDQRDLILKIANDIRSQTG